MNNGSYQDLHISISVTGTTLRRLWNGLDRANPTNREVDVSLLLPVAVGWDSNQYPYFMIILTQKPHKMSTLQSIDIQIRQRRGIDDKWTLKFTLLDEGLFTAFSEFCCSLVSHIRETSNPESATRAVYRTIDEWSRLFREVEQDKQMIKLRGLVAELVAALIIARSTSFTLTDVIEGWVGPYGAAQDFRLDGEEYAWEVKSLHPTSQHITVSSAQQLGDTEIKQLELITVVLKPADVEGKTGISLQDIADILRNACDSPSVISHAIDDALNELGLQTMPDVVRETKFIIPKAAIYEVKGDFPRILAENVPITIHQLTYTIRLTDIDTYKVAVSDEPLKSHMCER